MSNTVALALIIIGMVGVCGSVFLLVVLAVVWWFASRKESPVTVLVQLDEEELKLFRDHDTGLSRVESYELFDEDRRVELVPGKQTRQGLQIRPRPGLIAPAMPPSETIGDPETDAPIAFGEEEM